MEKLALIHGEKYRTVPKDLIEPPWPKSWISDKDVKAVAKVIRKSEFWKKEEINKLEKEWTEYCGAEYTIALNSGTAALHIAISAAGVGPGDEVITPSFSFLASSAAILQNQGIPIFVDIDSKTFNINPELIERKITNKTKAIIPVHIHGLPADMDTITDIAKKYGLVIIEDACQAHGAKYKGKKVGSLGHAAAFSLNPSKNLPAFGGGLLTLNDRGIKRKISKEVHNKEYETYILGWNYGYNEISATFVRNQLKKLDKGNKKRQENAEYLTNGMEEVKGIFPPYVPEDRTHIYYMYRILLRPEELGLNVEPTKFRDSVLEALLAEGIIAQTYETIPLPSQSIFRRLVGYGKGCPWNCKHARKIDFEKEYDESNYPETIKILNSSIVIHDPLYPPNSKELIRYYIKAFKKVFMPKNLEKILAR